MPNPKLEKQWKKIKLNKCVNSNGEVDLQKLGKIYLNLISKELKSSKNGNVQNINILDKTAENYHELSKPGLSGEEKYIENVIKNVNAKYHLDEAFEEYRLGTHTAVELISQCSEKDVKNAFYKNISTNDAIAAARNRISFFSHINTSISRGEITDEVEDCRQKYIIGTLKELQNVYKNRSFFYKLIHPRQMRELRNIIHETKEHIHVYILGNKLPLTKTSEMMIDEVTTTDYNEGALYYEGFKVNLYKFFGLKTFTETYNSSNTAFNKNKAKVYTDGIYGEPKVVIKADEYLKTSIEVKQIQEQLELNNKMLIKNNELISKLTNGSFDLDKDDNIINENNFDDSFSDNSGMKEKDDSFSL